MSELAGPLVYICDPWSSDTDPPALSYMLWYVTLRCVWLVCVPVLVFAQRTVKGVWDHFRLLDVPLCYCASEITWPSIPRTLFPYQRFDSFAQKCPEGIQEFISGTLVYVGFYGLFVLIVWIFCFQFSFLRFLVLFCFFFVFFLEQCSSAIFTHCWPSSLIAPVCGNVCVGET